MYVLNRRMFQRGKDNKYFWFHEQSNTFFSVKTYLCCIKENSMTVNEARLIYFSPTHTSKQVAEAIVHGTGIKNVISINLTLQTVEETVIPTSALAVIVVPVYGGHVAPLAMERLESIRGLDTPAVLVVVYGNRAYEKALMELDAFAIPHGLKVIAGATFIGEQGEERLTGTFDGTHIHLIKGIGSGSCLNFLHYFFSEIFCIIQIRFIRATVRNGTFVSAI